MLDWLAVSIRHAGDKFKLSVEDSEGWEWKSDSNNKDRPKYGYISTAPGGWLHAWPHQRTLACMLC